MGVISSQKDLLAHVHLQAKPSGEELLSPLLDSVCSWHKSGGEELSPGRANLSSECLRYRGRREAAGKKNDDFLPDVLSYSCSTPSSREWDEEGGAKPR